MKLTIFLITLSLLFVTNANAQLRRNIFAMSNAVSCAEAKVIVSLSTQRFKAQGIDFRPSLKCVSYNKTYGLGESGRQLKELMQRHGKKSHFIVAPFNNYFDGIADRNSKSSLYVAKPNRLWKSSNGLMHEIGHTLRANHDFSRPNIMGYVEEYYTEFTKGSLVIINKNLRLER